MHYLYVWKLKLGKKCKSAETDGVEFYKNCSYSICARSTKTVRILKLNSNGCTMHLSCCQMYNWQVKMKNYNCYSATGRKTD